MATITSKLDTTLEFTSQILGSAPSSSSPPLSSQSEARGPDLEISFDEPIADLPVVSSNIEAKACYSNLTRGLAKDPIGVYNDLRNRRIAGDEQFSFPEVAGTLDFLAHHAVNIPHSAVADKEIALREKGLADFANKAQELKSKNYPYLDSLIAIHFHLNSLVYYYATIKAYSGVKSDAVGYPHLIDDELWTMYNKIRNDPSFIVFPTTEELTPGYFAEIQSVRAYPLGVIANPMIWADGKYHSLFHFFIHDAAHIADGELAFEQTRGQSAEEKSQRIQKNYLIIKEEFAKPENKELWEACELLLFDLFHERGAIKADPIALKTKLANRKLASYLKKQIERGFFGEGHLKLVPLLEKAQAVLIKIVEAGVLIYP